MNREIKFRAWDKEKKRMIFGPTQDSNHSSSWVFTMYESQKDILDQIVLMQYTGLSDKNGKEIYDGDVIMYFREEIKSKKLYKCPLTGKIMPHSTSSEQKAIYEVKWKNEDACWSPFHSRLDSYFYLGGCELDELEIIGNVHENPELLKEIK